MKKSGIICLIATIVLIGLFEIQKILSYLLSKAELAMRPWVNETFLIGMCLCVVAMAISAIIFLICAFKAALKGRKIFCVVDALGILGVIIAGAFVGYLMLLAVAFSRVPEHVIERDDGKTYVACVHSFLQETVMYYEYRGPFLMAEEWEYYEDYGNGGSDPIKEGLTPINVYQRGE